MESPVSQDVSSRRTFRTVTFQLLYALDSLEYELSVHDVLEDFNQGFDLTIEHDGEIATTVQTIVDHKIDFDKLMTPLFANWRPERIGSCTHLILLIALWEYFFTTTPPVIIINEAIELAKNFSEKDAYKFVNGILDELFKRYPQRVLPAQ